MKTTELLLLSLDPYVEVVEPAPLFVLPPTLGQLVASLLIPEARVTAPGEMLIPRSSPALSHPELHSDTKEMTAMNGTTTAPIHLIFFILTPLFVC